jgi:seryl-tRNA synthetase
MLDLKFIRENIDLVQRAVANRQTAAPLDEILRLDAERRHKILELESLRHTRKEAGKERNMSGEAVSEGRSLRDRIKALEVETSSLDKQLEELLLQVPNIPHPTTPIGSDESGNFLVRSWEPPTGSWGNPWASLTLSGG